MAKVYYEIEVSDDEHNRGEEVMFIERQLHSFKKRNLTPAVECLDKAYCGLMSERHDLLQMQNYVLKFNGDESAVANTVFHMTINTISNMICGVTSEERIERMVKDAPSSAGD